MDWNIDGYWKINNNGDEHVGRLYVNQDNGIIHLTIYFNGKELFASILALPLEIEFINGRTPSGAKLTRLNCKRYGMKTVVGMRNEFSYTARFLINGCNFDKSEDIVFSEIYFQLSNIVKWGGVSKFDFDFDEKSEFNMSSNFIDPINIYANDEFEVSYVLGSSTFSTDTLIEKFEYEQRPQICIKSKTAQNIHFFLDKLECIKRLIDFAIGGKTGIVAIWACSPTILENLSDTLQREREIEIFHCYPKENYSLRYSWHEYLFTLPTLIEHANLKNWFEKYELLEPIIELYVEDLRSTDMSITRRFLGIVQALETYHSRIICNGDSSLALYKKRIESIIRITSESNQIFHRNMLLADCKGRISLVARIYDLVLANFDIWFETADYKIDKFAKVVAYTRHYLTHYNINEKDEALTGEDLYTAYEVLQYILIYYLLNELGFSRDHVRNKIGEKQSSLNDSLMLRNQDRANKN